MEKSRRKFGPKKPGRHQVSAFFAQRPARYLRHCKVEAIGGSNLGWSDDISTFLSVRIHVNLVEYGSVHEAKMRAVFLAIGMALTALSGVAASAIPSVALNRAATDTVRSCPEPSPFRQTGGQTGANIVELVPQPISLGCPAGGEATGAPIGPLQKPSRGRGVARIRFRPSNAMVRKLAGRPIPDVIASAREQWDVSPGSTQTILPGIHLPDQISRIKATEFAPFDHVAGVLKGGFVVQQGPTRAYRINDVDLVDGVLYGPNTQRHLRPRRARSPFYKAPSEAMSGAIYESWNGNRWFGCWLAEDCLAYPLAEAFGTPVATPVTAGWGHRPAYNARLGIAPRQIDAAHFDELILFDDMAGNAGRMKRAEEMRNKLVQGCQGVPVPGVFLLRGKSGDLRLMANEGEIAQRLATDYGFLILDPATASLDELAAACSQARVIAGVEGSHLVHGAVMMPPDATLFVIQPPTRATVFLKALTDLRGQRFAFVVAEGGVDGFTCDWTDIQRTLDLALAA